MRLKDHFRQFPRALSADECERICALGTELGVNSAKVKHDPTNKVRSSDVAWIRNEPDNAWVYALITPFVEQANSESWGFDIEKPETAQYTVYAGGQYYGWHADQRKEPYGEKSRWPGLTRKLSVTVQLSEGTDYQGGDFEIEDLSRGPDHMDKRLTALSEGRQLGSVLVFPSHLYHRVTEVTGGIRKSLVIWYLGPPYR